MFRAGFDEAPALVNGVTEGDAAHAEVVGDHLALLSIGLHCASRGRRPQALGHARGTRAVLHHPRRADEAAPRRDARAPHRVGRRAARLARERKASGCRGGSVRARRHQRGAGHPPARRRSATSCRSWRRRSPRKRSTGSRSTAASRRRRARPGFSSARSSPRSRTAARSGCTRTCPVRCACIWRLVGKPKYEANRKALLGAKLAGGFGCPARTGFFFTGARRHGAAASGGRLQPDRSGSGRRSSPRRGRRASG